MRILCVFIFSIIVNKLRSTVKIFDHKHRFNRPVRRNFERDYEHGQQNSLQHVRQDILNPSQLAKHMLTHTDEEPHKYEQCNKSFSLAKDLKKHLLTHTGEKPHKCAQCKKAFSEHRWANNSIFKNIQIIWTEYIFIFVFFFILGPNRLFFYLIFVFAFGFIF